MPVMSIQAVIFDLGNTLWMYTGRQDMETVHRLQAERLQPLLKAWGVPGNLPLAEIQRDLWDAYETAWRLEDIRGGVREPDRALIVQGALAGREVFLSLDQAEQWWRTAWVPVRHLGVELYPDTIDVLRELHERGLRIAINSNRPCTGDMMRPDFDDFGMTPYIDVAVCSGDTGFVKPHPSTFELVIEKLGVDPQQVVMVGDSCERDCAPARLLGMTSVLKLNGLYDTKPCGEADFVIHDLAELLSLPVFHFQHPIAAESATPHDDANEDRY
jgi:HAD superfamily hydrolase (TIGR01509 family)